MDTNNSFIDTQFGEQTSQDLLGDFSEDDAAPVAATTDAAVAEEQPIARKVSEHSASEQLDSPRSSQTISSSSRSPKKKVKPRHTPITADAAETELAMLASDCESSGEVEAAKRFIERFRSHIKGAWRVALMLW